MNAGASVTIAAVLALAAWAPIVLKHFDDQPVADRPVQSASMAIDLPPFPESRPQAELVTLSIDESLIDPGFSPLILEPPTVAPSYVKLASFATR